MKEKESTEQRGESRACWENLDQWARVKIQGALQDLLEAEVTELLGRVKSERKMAVDAAPGYRNGHGKPRKVTLGAGTVEVRRPRVRGLEERFESRVLPMCLRKSRQVDELIPELYLHGLAEGDFDLALRGLLGDDAPLSASTVARLKEKWHAELEEWRSRRLDELQVAYLWVDGLYVKAGLEKEKAALLVVMAGLSDGRKVILALTAGARESTESWSGVLRDLRDRGVNKPPRIVVGDGNLGIWAALRNVWPEAAEQQCWNHKILNVLDKVPKKYEKAANLMVRQIPRADSRKEAERLKKKFQDWCLGKDLKDAAAVLDRNWDRMVTFYSFPKVQWQHLRTSNPVESPFAGLRLRTNAAKRFKKVERATAVIWKMLMIAEKKFRRLKAPDLMKDVYEGTLYSDGVRVNNQVAEETAA